MSELKEVIASYNNLSFCDRIVFYTTISNDITITDDVQSFLIDTRFEGDCSCIYCEGTHVVKKRQVEGWRPTVSVPGLP